jgi:hypothetical protein
VLFIAHLLGVRLRDLADEIPLEGNARSARLDLFGRTNAETGMNLTANEAPWANLDAAGKAARTGCEEFSAGEERERVCAVARSECLAVEAIERGWQ